MRKQSQVIFRNHMSFGQGDCLLETLLDLTNVAFPCLRFYDSQGPGRLPMVIISPWVKPGYTDSTKTTFAGVVRFAEISLGLPSMNANDASAYPYTDAFDFTTPHALVQKPALSTATVPQDSRRYVSRQMPPHAWARLGVTRAGEKFGTAFMSATRDRSLQQRRSGRREWNFLAGRGSGSAGHH